MERRPAVAGAFYPDDGKELHGLIEGFMEDAEPDRKAADSAISYVAPHAGYIYSGHVAAFTYKALGMRPDLGSIETFVIIGPNHTGNGDALSVSGADWNTPLGTVRNDIAFARAMTGLDGRITIDEEAHASEHSIEVQLPLLQTVVKRPRCCFICMGDQSYEAAELLSCAITGAAEKLNRKVSVIASSDFNHYESEAVSRGKDLPAIGALERLNPREFHRLIEGSGDSACGYGPITVAAMQAASCGAMRGKLLKYATSGAVTGDYGSVVAYASIVFCR